MRAPAALRRSGAYWEDPAGATALWEDGFRPVRALDLEPGMLACYRRTDVFRFGPVGPVETARILRIDCDARSGIVTLVHTGGEAEEDEDAEVWVKRAPPPLRDDLP